jgi:hypothetical protein
MLDYQGKKRISDSFDELGGFRFQKIVWVRKNGSLRLFDDRGQQLFPDVEAFRPDEFKKFVYARRSGKWGLFNLTRGWVNTPVYDTIQDEEDEPQLLAVTLNVNKDGLPVSPKYPNQAFWFSQQGKWMLTDTSGIPFPGVVLDAPKLVQLLGPDRFALADDTDRRPELEWKLYDRTTGEQITDQSFEEIIYRDKGIMSVRRKGLWGRIDEYGQIKFPIILEYDLYRGLVGGRSVIVLYGEAFWVDEHGRLARR